MISFIVPAHNEEQMLGRTLDALHAAARSALTPYELIVVDDASTDRTAEIAAASGAQVVSVEHRQIARARNAGAKAAAGDVFVFVDADTRIEAATIVATVAAVGHGCVGGGALLRFDEPVPASLRLIGVCLRITMRLGRLAGGAYVFATRNAFEGVGGFDETLFATEELTLSRALRRVGRFTQGADPQHARAAGADWPAVPPRPRRPPTARRPRPVVRAAPARSGRPLRDDRATCAPGRAVGVTPGVWADTHP
ncbi:MAG: glycosyltransferase [Vicinamibacteria bacterium]|nr:glycosyltransferase [Vicinamibacteria bacterium]